MTALGEFPPARSNAKFKNAICFSRGAKNSRRRFPEDWDSMVSASRGLEKAVPRGTKWKIYRRRIFKPPVCGGTRQRRGIEKLGPQKLCGEIGNCQFVVERART